MLGSNAASLDKSLRTIWNGTNHSFYMQLFVGSPPALPETATSALSVATFSGSSSIYFKDAAYDSATYLNVVISKYTAAWTTTAGAGGVVGFFRIYDPAATAGVDTGISDDTGTQHYPRIQGTVGTTSGYDLVMTNTNVANGQSITIDVFNIILF